MSVRRVQFRRGTTAENSAFTGAVGELTVNTSTKAVRVHDGSTLGGTELARADLDNINFTPNATVDFRDSANGTTIRLTNVADPTNAQDVATKQYVLDTINGGEVVLNELGDVTINNGTLTDAHILAYDSTDGDGEWKNVGLSGDITMSKTGVTAIGNLKVTNAMLAGSIANNKLSNSTITFADADSNTSVALGGTITFQGVANETTVENVAGTYTIGLPDDVTIQNDLSVGRDLSITRNLTITGDLTVNGQTTTVNSTTVSTQDVVIELASNADANANATTDAGILITRGSTEAPAIMAWDEGVDKFILATAQGATGATTDFSGVGITLAYQPLKIGALEATADSSITASLTIQADNENLLVKTNAGTTKFSVDSDNGNTVIEGSLNVNSGITASGLVMDNGATITTVGGTTSFDANNITTTATITGNALVSTTSVSADSATITHGTSTNTLDVNSTSTFAGDLTIETDASLKIQKATVATDPLIIVNSNVTGASSDAMIIAVERGTDGADATLEWDEDNDKWLLSNNVGVGNNFTVAGTTVITSTTTLQGETTVTANLLVKNGANTNFQVTQATGETTIAGLLNANGGIAVDTNKFTVADGSGNTSIDGTLAVNGISTLSNQLKVQGGNNLTVYSDVGTTAKFTITGSNGNTDIQGTLNVEGATEVDDTLNVTGATTLQSTLGVTSTTTLSGLLNANAGIAVDTNKFTVADGSGDTAIAGTLGVTGITTIAGLLNANGGIDVDSGKFSVADSTGVTTLGTDAYLKINKQTTTTNPVILLNANRTGNGEEADVVAIEVERGALTNAQLTWNETTDAWTIPNNIAQTGANTLSTGTGAVSLNGNTTITGTNTFTSGTGNVSLLGATSVKANLTAIDNADATKFSVDNSTGNTRVYGTFTSDGASTLKSATTIQDDLTVKNGSGGADVLFVDVSVPSVAITGALSVSGISTLSEDLKIQNSNDLIIYSDNPGTVEKFKVLGASGNTSIAGTLGVSGATTLSNTLGVTGITTLTGALNANGGIAVDTNAFTVADTTGNTAIAGTLDVTGISTLTGLLNANGGIAVDTTNFTVDGTTGATAIASTLTVNGITTVKDDLLLHGGAGKDVIIYSDAGTTPKFTINSETGNTSIVGTLGVTGATTLSNTLGVTGVSTFSNTIQPDLDSQRDIGTTGTRWATLYVDDITTTSSVTANTLTINSTATITGEVNINGGLKLDTDKFIVADTTGNTTIAGTALIKSASTLESNLTIKNGSGGSDTFTVASATGNTAVSGTLGVTGITTLSDDLLLHGGAGKDLIVYSDAGATPKFTVNSVSGNTDIQGTLNVEGASEIDDTLNVTGATTLQSTLGVTGTSTLAGLTATSFSTSASSITLNSAGTVQDVSIIVERGANDASIKWNETSDKWTVTENGTNFYDILNSNTTIFNATNGTTNKAFVSGNTLTIQGDGQNVTVAHGGNGTFTLGLSSAIVLDGSLTVSGNATFNGAQLRLKDPLFFIGDSNTSTVNHVGFFGKYEDGIGTVLYSGLIYQPGNTKFVLFADNTSATATASQITPTSSQYASLTLGGLTLDKANSSLTIQNGSAVTQFEVDSDNGNTTINGTLSLKGDGTSLITLNSDLGAVNASANVGLIVKRGNYTDSQFYWDETANRWTINNPDDAFNAPVYNPILTQTEGSRYACTTPTFIANATTISAPASSYINKNAYFLSNGGNAGTVNLFALSGTTYDGYVILFVNTDATATMTIDANLTQTINGSLTQNIVAGGSLTIIANGTSWYII